jgi:hypothetical protein
VVARLVHQVLAVVTVVVLRDEIGQVAALEDDNANLGHLPAVERVVLTVDGDEDDVVSQLVGNCARVDTSLSGILDSRHEVGDAERMAQRVDVASFLEDVFQRIKDGFLGGHCAGVGGREVRKEKGRRSRGQSGG